VEQVGREKKQTRGELKKPKKTAFFIRQNGARNGIEFSSEIPRRIIRRKKKDSNEKSGKNVEMNRKMLSEA
jgi:hypothetical protein